MLSARNLCDSSSVSLKRAGLNVTGSLGGRGPYYGAGIHASRTGVDVAPQVRAAGANYDHSSARTFSSVNVVISAPQTPEGVEKQRLHKKREDCGVRTVHWGLKGLSIPEPSDGYGVKSVRGDGVPQNFQSGQLFGVAEYLNSRGESIYHSTKREALGTSYVRGHSLPCDTRDPAFRGFGRPRGPVNCAKETIFPRFTSEDERRVRTHGNFHPGESVCRNYSLPPKVHDPHFRYGAVEAWEPGMKGNGVKNALNVDSYNNETSRTKIVQRTSEDHRQVCKDHLGEIRNAMQGSPPVPPDHVYGLKREPEHTAGELIRGVFAPQDEEPDTVGRCSTQGRRNFFTHRRFGMATIRDDLMAPSTAKRKMIDATNYGDEVPAYRLICPQRFDFQGLSESDFRMRREKEDMRGIFEGAGYLLDPADFDMLWDVAVGLFEDDAPLASVEAFIHCYSDWVASNVV